LKAEEEIAILKQRLYSRRLPSSYSLLDHSIDSIEQMLQGTVLNEDRRVTLLARRSKTIAQFKFDLMVLTITTVEERLRSHTNVISIEKNKLLTMGPLASFDPMMKLIEARRGIMKERSECLLQRKLSFFDRAPTDHD
jgi:hypothetical protein